MLTVVFYNIATKHISFSHLTLWVSALSAWLNYVIKKDGVNLGFNIFIKNYVMRYKPSLFISLAYFSPLLEGKMLEMPDIKNYLGASKEIIDFREATGNEALWTNSMFSGMPAYQISTRSNANLIQYVAKVITLGIPRPASYIFLSLLGFYILLVSLKVDYRLSAVGAIAFAFSSYFLA